MTVFSQDFLLQHCRPRSTTSVRTLRATHTGHMGQSYDVFRLLRDVTHHLEKTVSTAALGECAQLFRVLPNFHSEFCFQLFICKNLKDGGEIHPPKKNSEHRTSEIIKSRQNYIIGH